MVIGLTEVALACAVPALLVAILPRRLLWAGVVLWIIAPLLVYAGIIGWEFLTRPAAGYTLWTALYGLALITPIALPIWCVVCVVGFGVGAVLRRPLRLALGLVANPPRAAGTPAPPPAAGTPTPPPAAGPGATQPTPAWHHVHIGFAPDALRIGGIEVWKEPWRPVDKPAITLPHPSHPGQMHRFEIFEIGGRRRPVRFAACELSNSVWGFATRDGDPVQVQGGSTGGTLP